MLSSGFRASYSNRIFKCKCLISRDQKFEIKWLVQRDLSKIKHISVRNWGPISDFRTLSLTFASSIKLVSWGNWYFRRNWILFVHTFLKNAKECLVHGIRLDIYISILWNESLFYIYKWDYILLVSGSRKQSWLL